MAERIKAGVLKTSGCNSPAGSNPALSAKRMKHIIELELSWCKNSEVGSFICEDGNCDACEFRFACYTTSDVVVECNRKFPDYHSAMRYRKRLRKRFPRSRLYD